MVLGRVGPEADRLPVRVRGVGDLRTRLDVGRDVRPAVDGRLRVVEGVELRRGVLDRDRRDVRLGEDGRHEEQVGGVQGLEVHDARRARPAVDPGDLVPAGDPGIEAGLGRIHDPLPGGLEVGARDRRAVRPEHPGLELPGDVHAGADLLHVPVGDGRDVGGHVGHVGEVVADGEEGVERRGRRPRRRSWPRRSTG